MRCPQCAERNSVAARKCEFCGNKFKKKPFPLGLKLACGGVAVAVTASVAASYLVPRLVDPEQNLERVAKKVAAGPSSVDHATKIKKEFGAAVKDFLKTSGDQKTATLTRDLQKLLPSSAFEVHVVDLPRGLRVVEVDTVLQATGFLVMKTSAGMKVFDLPGFEVFDDARILNDSAGPVLALLGHTGGPPPHKPIVRTYALLPDYIADETDKLVPPLKVEGSAKFAKNNHDVNVEFVMPPAVTAKGTRKPGSSGSLAFGTLKWKDARYTSDFTAAATIAADRLSKLPPQTGVAVASTSAVRTPAPTAVAANAPAAAPTVSSPATTSTSSVATAPVKLPVAVAPVATSQKIVVRSFTGADAARSGNTSAAGGSIMASDSVLAAVPMAAPAINNARKTISSISSEFGSTKKASAPPVQSSSTRSSASSSRTRQRGEVICSGATLRSQPGRGSASLNNFGRGTSVTVLGKNDDWYHVRVNGQEGYIFSSLLSVGGSSSSSSSTSASSASRVAPTVVVASSSSGSSRSSRRRSRRSSQTLVAHSAPRRQVAAVEPILVP